MEKMIVTLEQKRIFQDVKIALGGGNTEFVLIWFDAGKQEYGSHIMTTLEPEQVRKLMAIVAQAVSEPPTDRVRLYDG
jgi:hypothetical protein